MAALVRLRMQKVFTAIIVFAACTILFPLLARNDEHKLSSQLVRSEVNRKNEMITFNQRVFTGLDTEITLAFNDADECIFLMLRQLGSSGNLPFPVSNPMF
ncbi:hypothetical protein B9T62_22550 [Paenibacillus donghaensis]|uniref:Uncharacterized protein n=1 Tax=Paenibacillus donghaensis TaxID=414771 RepID=A0A2Z2KLI5_9BACL|nr:hypothetical protein B9T62_22550 [Paenibacillus donghaensis]